MPHQIRLRGPWEHAGWSDTPSRVKFPATVRDLCSAEADRCVVSRFFHRPTGLDAATLTMLLETPAQPTQVRLNDAALELRAVKSGLWEVDLTDKLALRNRLEVTLSNLAEVQDQEKTALEVWLEIE